jgi:hypothetical protein
MSSREIFALISCLLLVSGVTTGVHAPSSSDVELAGEVTYSLQVDPIAGTSTASFSYVLEVDNSDPSTKQLAISLTLHDVDPASLKVVSGELTISHTLDLGRYVELVVQLSAPPGESSWELAGAPRWFPFEVNESLLVNNGPPNVTQAGEYRFLSANVGDVLFWRVRIKNTMLGAENDSLSPPVPVTLVVSLDKSYFELRTMTPRPNSTTTEGANYWVFLLGRESVVEIEAKVSKLSDWGVATVTPFIISYSSDQLPAMVQTMQARLEALNSTEEFFEGIWTMSNETTSVLSDLSGFLDAISKGMNLTGTASLTIGDSILSMSAGLRQIVSGLANYSDLVHSFGELATEQNINKTITNLKGNLTTTIAMLEATNSSIHQQQGMLLALNATLTALVETTNDTAQVIALNQAISMVSQIYQQNELTLQSIRQSLQNLIRMQGALAQIDVKLVADEVQTFVRFYDSFRFSMSGLVHDLERAGNASVQVGAADLNQSAVLLNMSSELVKGVNQTRTGLNDMWKVIADMKRSIDDLENDIFALSAESQRVSLTSPQIVASDVQTSFEVRGATQTDLFALLSHAEGSFVKYVSFQTGLDVRVFVQQGDGNWTTINDLGSLDTWQYGGLTYVPIFSKSDGPYLALGGQKPFRLMLPGGVTVNVYNGSQITSLVEQVSASVFQPDVARQIVIVTDGNKPPTPSGGETYPAIEVIAVGVILLLLFFVLLTWRRAGVMKEERKKRLEELGLGESSDAV